MLCYKYKMDVPILQIKRRRERSRNFLEREKETLVRLTNKYKSIIENKKTDAVTSNEKHRTWNKIAEEYNKTATTGIRSGIQLKYLYENMKRVAKKQKNDAQNDTNGATSTDTMKVEEIDIKDNENFYENNNLENAETTDPNTWYHDVPEQVYQEDLSNEINNVPSSSMSTSSKKISYRELNGSLTSGSDDETGPSKTMFIQGHPLSGDCTSSSYMYDEFLTMKKEKHAKKLKILDLVERKESLEVHLKELEIEARKLDVEAKKYEVEARRRELFKSSL